eukprot:2785321-Amphidinium_carterae.1
MEHSWNLGCINLVKLAFGRKGLCAEMEQISKIVSLSVCEQVITNSIILANALLLAIETQYHGVNDGADLMPEKYHEAPPILDG